MYLNHRVKKSFVFLMVLFFLQASLPCLEQGSFASYSEKDHSAISAGDDSFSDEDLDCLSLSEARPYQGQEVTGPFSPAPEEPVLGNLSVFDQTAPSFFFTSEKTSPLSIPSSLYLLHHTFRI